MKSLFRRADRSFGRKLDVVLALIRIYLSFIHSKKLPSPHSERLRGGIMTPVVAGKKLSRFDPKTFLSTMDGGRKIAAFAKKQTIFVQGDPSDAVCRSEERRVGKECRS